MSVSISGEGSVTGIDQGLNVVGVVTATQVKVGSAVTIHSGGFQVGSSDIHSTGIAVNRINIGTGASISSPATNVLTLGTNNAERVRIGSTGSVGIGTNESYGDSNASFTSLSLGGNGTRYGLMELNRSDGIAGSWIDCYGTGGNGDLRITTAGTSGAITFWTGGEFTEKVRINSSGNVGINSTSPRSKLDVGGELHLGRIDSSQEGGQLSLCRSSDNASTWSIDAYGSTSTPSIRFVDNIAGASRMEIDGSGRVKMPYQPAFTAYLSTNYSYTGGGARRAIPFDAVVTNIGSHFNTSTNRFIAPVAGMYLFTASLVCNSGSSTTYFSCDIFVNGAAVPGSSGWQNMGAGYQIQRSSLIAYLNVNDYVDVRMEKSANDTINGASNYSGFTGTLLG